MIIDRQFSLRIKEPSLLPNIWAILCLVLLFCIFYSYNSQMLICPGVTIDLPNANNVSYEKNNCMLTVQSQDFLILGSSFLSIKTLQSGLESFLKINPEKNNCLLIRLDQTLPIGQVIDICDIAKSAGFINIQIATNQKHE